jgi:hypothetical protein
MAIVTLPETEDRLPSCDRAAYCIAYRLGKGWHSLALAWTLGDNGKYLLIPPWP